MKKILSLCVLCLLPISVMAENSMLVATTNYYNIKEPLVNYTDYEDAICSSSDFNVYCTTTRLARDDGQVTVHNLDEMGYSEVNIMTGVKLRGNYIAITYVYLGAKPKAGMDFCKQSGHPKYMICASLVKKIPGFNAEYSSIPTQRVIVDVSN